MEAKDKVENKENGELKEGHIHRLDERNPDFETAKGNCAAISVKKGDHVFYFYMPFGAPLAECYDAAVEVLREIKITYDEAVKKMQEEVKKKDAEKKEDLDHKE